MLICGLSFPVHMQFPKSMGNVLGYMQIVSCWEMELQSMDNTSEKLWVTENHLCRFEDSVATAQR